VTKASEEISETISQLKAYLLAQKSDCDRVDSEWKIDLLALRFYFVRANKNEFELDIDKGLIEGTPASEIICQLETGNWQAVLGSDPAKVITLRDGRLLRRGAKQ